jgi:hypothetical protein
MKIAALAIDLDGTITDADRRLNLEAVRRIRVIEARGVPVVLATGNVLCYAEAASVLIGTTGPLIAENGGLVRDPLTGRLHTMGDIESVRRAFEYLSRYQEVRKVSGSDLRQTEIAIYRDHDVEEIQRILEGFPVEVVDTKFAIHIKDPTVSKGRALAQVGEQMGLDLEAFAAIGDSLNDREMLAVAGYSIAVGSGPLEDVADYVTRASYGEGGMEALEHLLTLLS